jgi:hypothetical protein
MEYTIAPLSEHTGAEARGIDLTKAIDPRVPSPAHGANRTSNTRSAAPRLLRFARNDPKQDRHCEERSGEAIPDSRVSPIRLISTTREPGTLPPGHDRLLSLD